MKEVIVFEAFGPYALFRKPYAALSPVSYPAPPPTAILGMVAAILGLEKREYLAKLGDRFTVAVRLLHSVRHCRAAINLLDTKLKDGFFSASQHQQIPFEFLRDPKYRIIFSHDDVAVMEELTRRLAAGRTGYTPCLGVAQCIAELRWIGRLPVLGREGTTTITTIVPISKEGPGLRYEQGVRYLRYLVPSRMTLDRAVTKYQEVAHAADGSPIEVANSAYWECGEDRVLFY